jgi:hypothetical protein
LNDFLSNKMEEYVKKQGIHALASNYYVNVRHTENIQTFPSFHGPDIVYKFQMTCLRGV